MKETFSGYTKLKLIAPTLASVHLFKVYLYIFVTSLLTNQNLFRDWWSYWEQQMHRLECLPLLCVCNMFVPIVLQKCTEFTEFKIYGIFVGTMQQCWHCHLLTDNENAACIIFFLLGMIKLQPHWLFPFHFYCTMMKALALCWCWEQFSESALEHICLLLCGTWCLIVFTLSVQ